MPVYMCIRSLFMHTFFYICMLRRHLHFENFNAHVNPIFRMIQNPNNAPIDIQ